MKAAQDRYKSHDDLRRRPFEFEIGNRVFLRVSPTKGVFRFGVRSKLNPRYIGPYEILEQIGPSAYRLVLPPSLSGVYNVFHVSQLRKCVSDQDAVLDTNQPEILPDLTTEEKPIKILGKMDKTLRNKIIPMVKVQWSNQTEREAVWEVESLMKQKYPELFE